MKEDRKEFVGYLPICPIKPEHPDMLIELPLKVETREMNTDYVSEFAMNTETWD